MVFKFSKINKKEQVVGGVIYAPGELDSDSDYSTAEEIKKGMYRFMEKYHRDTCRMNINHKGKNFSWPILENFIPDEDIKIGNAIVKAGSWWMAIRITDKTIFDQVLAGTLTGFSMEGRAQSDSA